jgi:hypothetical protein
MMALTQFNAVLSLSLFLMDDTIGFGGGMQ